MIISISSHPKVTSIVHGSIQPVLNLVHTSTSHNERQRPRIAQTASHRLTRRHIRPRDGQRFDSTVRRAGHRHGEIKENGSVGRVRWHRRRLDLSYGWGESSPLLCHPFSLPFAVPVLQQGRDKSEKHKKKVFVRVVFFWVWRSFSVITPRVCVG